jgi:hypothetical protein
MKMPEADPSIPAAAGATSDLSYLSLLRVMYSVDIDQALQYALDMLPLVAQELRYNLCAAIGAILLCMEVRKRVRV